MLDRLIDWLTVEPTISLLMTIAAVVLFASAFRAKADSDKLWPWLRRSIEASAGAVLFLGLLWAFRSILNNNVGTFQGTHGSLSETNLQSAQSIWGRPHVQRELLVNHYVWTEEQEEIPREDPSQPALYKTKDVRKHIPQNSIAGFKGSVDMTLNEREKGYALYNGYMIDAHFAYDVVNDSDQTTETDFGFPLSGGQTLFEDFQITVDGEDISSLLRFSTDWIQWTRDMQPGQHSQVIITYTSRGMDTFYYQIPYQRNIKDFELTLTADRLPTSLLNYPQGCLTPMEIQPTADQKGSILIWKLDKAITVAGMGVALPQPEQPGARVLRVLKNSPYALTLLGAMLALTWLIRSRSVHFLDLALLSGAYCVQFLIMAAVSDYFFGFWGSLALGAFLTSLLTFLLFRRHHSKLLRALTYFLVLFFTLVYPLAGLLNQTTERNAFDGLVQVGLIIYLFGLSLYTRVTQPQ